MKQSPFFKNTNSTSFFAHPAQPQAPSLPPTELNTLNNQVATDLVIAFFNNQTQTNFWKKGQDYPLNDTVSIAFKQDVLRRKRSKGYDVRYELISDHHLGAGSVGMVYEIKATLAIKGHTLQYKQHGYQNKGRVVKVQQHGDNWPIQEAIKEYQLTQQAHHLSIKEPVFAEHTSYTVMKKLKGRELFEVIFREDLTGKNPLTIHQRIDLTQALLMALKIQVVDKGLIHRDIKPENIIVDLNSPITVNIFDYGFSTQSRCPSLQFVGTPHYAAPEIFTQDMQTPALDIFSMGRILALLWHVNTKSYESSSRDLKALFLNASQIKLPGLFHGIKELNREDKKIIKALLKSMLKAKSEERPSVASAIEAFRPVYEKHHSSLKQAPINLAPETKKQTPNVANLGFLMFKVSPKPVLTPNDQTLYQSYKQDQSGIYFR